MNHRYSYQFIKCIFHSPSENHLRGHYNPQLCGKEGKITDKMEKVSEGKTIKITHNRRYMQFNEATIQPQTFFNKFENRDNLNYSSAWVLHKKKHSHFYLFLIPHWVATWIKKKPTQHWDSLSLPSNHFTYAFGFTAQ